MILAVSWLLCVSAHAEPSPKSISEHPKFSNLKKALTRFVEQRGADERATLIIPKYREEHEDVIIFWVEERALFDFPLGFAPEAAEHPILLNRRFWRLTDDFLYPADSKDPGHHSSTFMTTWEWAKEKVFAAVKDGCILSIEIRRTPEPSDAPNDGHATSVGNSEVDGGGRHR